MLREKLPGFSFEEILLKANAVNTLYATNVYAIWKAAKHIYNLMSTIDPKNVDIGLVEEMAKVPNINKRFTSFASKFAHFFIDEERFPIKDSYAEMVIRYHIGKINWVQCSEKPFFEYVQNFTNLKEGCSYTGSNRKLDRYLWLAGQFREWEKKKENAPINLEVKSFFSNSKNQEITCRAFKG
jgi:hypothetical protein